MPLRVDIANQVRQTSVPAWLPLLPLFEAIMNSFQAIREANLSENVRKQVIIEVIRDSTQLDVFDSRVSGFKVADNGIGLDERNLRSFNTAFSSHKLSRGGKGLGRFTWLKAFEHAEIVSVFKADNTFHKRDFKFDENYDSDGDAAAASPSEELKSSTVVELVRIRSQYEKYCPQTTEALVQKIVEHFLLIFLDSSCPQVNLLDGGLKTNLNQVFEKEYKRPASQHTFQVRAEEFSLVGFRIPTNRASRHKLVYAADQRAVLSDKLADYLPNLSSKLTDEDGSSFFYLGVIQGDYLSDRVNANRTNFEFGDLDDAEIELPLGEHPLLPKTEIREAAVPIVEKDLSIFIESINNAKLDRVKQYVYDGAPQYRLLLKHPDKFLGKLSAFPTRTEIESALHRELFIRETEFKKESSRIVREAGKITDYEEYRTRFEKFLGEYNELGISALAQYVQHRRIIIDFLEKAVKLSEEDRKFALEKVVHNLVFPMKFTSEDIPSSEQNLWLIDERLTFHSLINSDIPNKKIPVLESEDRQRGDIVIFDEKILFTDERPDSQHPLNSVVVIEFKRPGRKDYSADDNPVLQATNVIKAIRSSKYLVKGRALPIANETIPAMVFVVADLVQKLRDVLVDYGALVTPDGQGYYGFHPNHKVYYEVVDYTKMLSDAKKRNRIFFDKLNVVDTH